MRESGLSESHILVTGASSGIGRGCAIRLAEMGARVVLVGRDRGRLDATTAELPGTGHRAIAFDLGRVDEIPDWLKTVVVDTGPIRGIVHCAGIQTTQAVRGLNTADIERMFRINVTAGLMLTKAYRQRGVFTNPGSIVFMASARAFRGESASAAYAASKGAVVSMTTSLAAELARDGIRVNAIAPAYVRTEMLAPLERALSPAQFAAVEAKHLLGFGEPEDIAAVAAFLLGDDARWITGTTVVVDGGYSVR